MPSSESSIRKDSMCLTSCIDSVISYIGFDRESTSTITRWYNFETLSQTDDFCRAAVESVHIVQSVQPIARWKAK